MIVTQHLRLIRNRIRSTVFKSRNSKKEQFICPICNYHGPFRDHTTQVIFRTNAKCPSCGSLERHRLQYIVVQSVLEGIKTSKMRMLHFAPELWLRDWFSKCFGSYLTADLSNKRVNCRVDLQILPFASSSIDFVFASHVLEHISNDLSAILEIRRILTPNGIAILPVPIISDRTIEYHEPNPYEHNHVRAPGLDYFDRFTPYFSRVDQYASNMFPEEYQLYLYADRSNYPTKKYPMRQPMQGIRHTDYVPVCFV